RSSPLGALLPVAVTHRRAEQMSCVPRRRRAGVAGDSRGDGRGQLELGALEGGVALPVAGRHRLAETGKRLFALAEQCEGDRRQAPVDGPVEMVVGMFGGAPRGGQRFLRLLAAPFRSQKGGVPPVYLQVVATLIEGKTLVKATVDQPAH